MKTLKISTELEIILKKKKKQAEVENTITEKKTL